MWSLAFSSSGGFLNWSPFKKKICEKRLKIEIPPNICLYFNPHTSSGSVTYVVTPMIEWLYAFNLVSHT